jgi:hypothetical protein
MSTPKIVVKFDPAPIVTFHDMDGVSVALIERSLQAILREYQVNRQNAIHRANDELKSVTQRSETLTEQGA